jgi:hypothetical protein
MFGGLFYGKRSCVHPVFYLSRIPLPRAGRGAIGGYLPLETISNLGEVLHATLFRFVEHCSSNSFAGSRLAEDSLESVSERIGLGATARVTNYARLEPGCFLACFRPVLRSQRPLTFRPYL